MVQFGSKSSKYFKQWPQTVLAKTLSEKLKLNKVTGIRSRKEFHRQSSMSSEKDLKADMLIHPM